MKETKDLNYKEEYYRLQEKFKYELEERTNCLKEELDKERNTKNAIIESQQKEIEFYKEIIKGILHIRQVSNNEK